MTGGEEDSPSVMLSAELRMQILEPCCVLIRTREGAQLCILIQPAEKRETDGRAGTADGIVVTIVDLWWHRRVIAAYAIGHNHRRMPGKVRRHQLLATAWRDDHIDISK